MNKDSVDRRGKKTLKYDETGGEFYKGILLISFAIFSVIGLITGIVVALIERPFWSLGLPAGPIIGLIIILAGILLVFIFKKNLSLLKAVFNGFSGGVIGYFFFYLVFYWAIHWLVLLFNSFYAQLNKLF